MSTKRILMIDDEETLLGIVRIILSKTEGWEVITAGSGREGLKIAEAERPDAILLDVMMPEMDGMTTFRNLQANQELASIPTIFITARVELADQAEYRELGVKSVIPKPFDPLSLGQQIRQTLGWN